MGGIFLVDLGEILPAEGSLFGLKTIGHCANARAYRHAVDNAKRERAFWLGFFLFVDIRF